jgi:hypothetical protein
MAAVETPSRITGWSDEEYMKAQTLCQSSIDQVGQCSILLGPGSLYSVFWGMQLAACPQHLGATRPLVIVQSIAIESDRLERLEAQLKELGETGHMLSTMADKIQHSVMVPFGRVAMFPGT